LTAGVPQIDVAGPARLEIRERAAGEALIRHDTDWRFENRDYRGHDIIFVERFFGESSMQIFPIN
jgi:hypothetical protein